MEQVLKHECKWFIFQEETGDEGTPHLQGTLSLLKKKRLTELKALNPTIHWEATKSVTASMTYCTKHASRTGKIFHYGCEIPSQVDVEEPFGWQLIVTQIIETVPDKRTIHWFWEPTGGVGKTTLCKYLVARRGALMLTGKSADMYHMLSKFPDKRRLILVDVPRSTQEYINYGAIEQIKNGLIFSGKYEGTQLVFNCPHVIVFANEPPDTFKMSQDRWNIVEIGSTP